METQTFLHSKVRAYETTVREDITRFCDFFYLQVHLDHLREAVHRYNFDQELLLSKNY